MHYEFTKNLETGHEIIDSEHKMIIQHANEILSAIEEGLSDKKVLEAINTFAKYINTHFPHEEALQEKFFYPNIRFHKLWHQSYTKEIDLTCNRILTEGISNVTIAELKRRIETLIQHILLEDSRVAKHIQSIIKNNKEK